MLVPVQKTLEEHFIDWHGDVFPYGYGTGEEFIIPKLRLFMGFQAGAGIPYDHSLLEEELGPAIAWLLINALCKARVVEYGSSPRFGWLTGRGKKVKKFMLSRSVDDLVQLVTDCSENYVHCYPDACNCGPNGYDETRKCPNPFWCD